MENKLTWTLIITNILVFELVYSMPQALFDQAIENLAFSPALFFQPWRWFTSMFLHANASHLFFNMIGLYFFGRVVEGELSGRQWLGIYFLAGLGGSLLYGLTSSMSAVGASGCIFGLLGAAMLLKPKEPIRLYFFPLPLGFIAILFILSQAALAAMPASSVGIAYMAHVGGLLVGLGLAFIYDSKQSMKGLFWMAVCVGLLLIIGPLISILVFLGEVVLGVFDMVIGFVLYGAAQLLFSWIWAIVP